MLRKLCTVCLLGLWASSQPLTADEVRPSPEPQQKSTASTQPATPPPPPLPEPITKGAKPQTIKQVKPEAFTDTATAGEDFITQGEYTGRVENDGAPEWYGVQVVALGESQFDVVIYRGGLPGNDWDGQPPVKTSTTAVDDGYEFDWDDQTATLNDKRIHVTDSAGKQIGRLTKVRRSSRTLGQKPPEGAVVLFNGSSIDALEGGRMTDDGLLMQGFKTTQTFGSFTLHAEFRTPFMPTARGQARGNSGIYMQSRYETQILDSFGLEGENNEAGGIYEISDPAMNVCFPPLSWQTYDIDFTAATYDNDGEKTADARMTVQLNGVVVQDDVPVPRSTRAAPLEEGPEPGPLYVQDHGNPVRFRNIWIVRSDVAPKLPPVPLVGKRPPMVSGDDDDEMPRVTDEWIKLFDGKSLDGWHKNPDKIGHGTGGSWSVEDGVIAGEQDPPGSGNGGILMTDQVFGDFELSIDMKPDWGVCSGLFLRGTETGKCFQMMVDYHDAGNVGHIYGEGTGGFTNRPFSIFGDVDDGTLKSLRTESTENVFDGYTIDGDAWVNAWKVGEWNTAVVRVVGQPPVITTWINGVKVTELDASKFKHPKYDIDAVAEALGSKGHIAVQVHGGDGWPPGAKCRWRNIKVNPLD